MSMIKVFGIGSPFGEDQIGWRVAEVIQQRLLTRSSIHPYVQIECCDRPGTRLIELMQNAPIVFLIDAVVTGSKIGTIHRLQNDEIHEFKGLLSTHHFGVAQALQIGDALNMLPENVILYGIEIGDIEFNTNISQSVSQAINQVAIQVKNEIIDLLVKMKGIDPNEISR